jgi:hypothetical protein
MDTTNTTPMTVESIERQQKYVREQQEKGNGLGIVFADAFLRGMRDLGYKNPAWALAEMIDNSFQATADIVAVRFEVAAGAKGKSKPATIAICDNGSGMIPDMISYSVRWGGTDREGDRHGLGRYGYGLPSAAVSLAQRYSVYSKVKGGNWHRVTVDIKKLAAAANDPDRTKELLAAVEANLPEWLLTARDDEDKLDLAQIESGTVVILEDLDRLRTQSGWVEADTLRTKLLQHFGVIYRYWLPERRVSVHGVQAAVVDPLFLMEHGRFFDETAVRAERVQTRTFTVTTSRNTTGTVSIRAAVLPPNFQLVKPEEYNPNAEGGARGNKLNSRHPIMRDYNGLLICRERRQIDTITPRGMKFQTYDYNVKIEIDFDPELDEFFGITTAKQQIVIDDTMWQQLIQDGANGGGLKALVRSMRGRFHELRKDLAAKYQAAPENGAPRPSEAAMEESAKFKPSVVTPTSVQQEEAERNLDQEATQRAEASGLPKARVLPELRERTTKKHWEVDFKAIAEGPFYRPVRLGDQKRLIINTDHPFYEKVYSPAGPDGKAALEVLLFVLAERELEARNEAEQFYKAERQQWSERLRHALDALIANQSMVDLRSSMAEEMFEALEEAETE